MDQNYVPVFIIYHKRISTKVFLISSVKQRKQMRDANAYKARSLRNDSLDTRQQNETKRSARQITARETFAVLRTE